MTISEGIGLWLQRACAERKPRTQAYYREIAKILTDRWPDHGQEIGAVTEQEIEAFILRVAHYSAPRFNAIVSAIKAIIPQANFVRWRPVPLKERANLSQMQFAQLLRELDDRPRSHAGLIVRFLSHTGLRINEARQMRWKWVMTDYFYVPAQITKNGKPRSIPFVNGIRFILDELRSVTGGKSEDLILPASEATRAIKTACKLVGIPPLAHHDFRHMFFTRCIESGVDMPTVARWGGHQDGGALLGRVYFHLSDNHSRMMARRVEI